MSVNFSSSNLTRSLAFEFLRAGYSVHMAITIRSGDVT